MAYGVVSFRNDQLFRYFLHSVLDFYRLVFSRASDDRAWLVPDRFQESQNIPVQEMRCLCQGGSAGATGPCGLPQEWQMQLPAVCAKLDLQPLLVAVA